MCTSTATSPTSPLAPILQVSWPPAVFPSALKLSRIQLAGAPSVWFLGPGGLSCPSIFLISAMTTCARLSLYFSFWLWHQPFLPGAWHSCFDSALLTELHLNVKSRNVSCAQWCSSITDLSSIPDFISFLYLVCTCPKYVWPLPSTFHSSLLPLGSQLRHFGGN